MNHLIGFLFDLNANYAFKFYLLVFILLAYGR
ncbi:protein of unknown function [Thermococcus nautili]|nr:protein of unknown function [Thermococcus nautili]